MTALAEPTLDDELKGVVEQLCVKFPARPKSEIEGVVSTAFARLSSDAAVTAHLIPLTLNLSRRLLSSLHPTTNADRSPDSGVSHVEGVRNGHFSNDF